MFDQGVLDNNVIGVRRGHISAFEFRANEQKKRGEPPLSFKDVTFDCISNHIGFFLQLIGYIVNIFTHYSWSVSWPTRRHQATDWIYFRVLRSIRALNISLMMYLSLFLIFCEGRFLRRVVLTLCRTHNPSRFAQTMNTVFIIFTTTPFLRHPLKSFWSRTMTLLRRGVRRFLRSFAFNPDYSLLNTD